MIITALHTASFVFAFAAAGFWFASTTVKMPVEITTGWGGSGGSVQELGDAVRKQGRRSAFAAAFAGLSALCQGVVLLLAQLNGSAG